MSKLKQLITEVIQKSENGEGRLDRQSLFTNMEEMAKIISVHGFMNVWFASYNISIRTIINNVFHDDHDTRNHLRVASEGMHLIEFMMDLDETNRGKIITFIMENYEGVNYESISKYYFK